MATCVQALRAGEIMTKTLVCASPHQDLEDVETLLIEHRISGVPVVDRGRLVGILSRTDIARVKVLMLSLDGQVTDQLSSGSQADGFQHEPRAEFQGFRQTITTLKVKNAMQDRVVTCTPESLVSEVAESMLRHQIHRVIVVDHDRPVGIISSLDMVKLVAGSDSAYTRK
jgi:CBS domain-containing protein